jgi:DNA excision repair protein ERCC-6-like 2
VQAQRQKKVDDFNNMPSTFIFMISTKAGGLGLNLTSANK